MFKLKTILASVLISIHCIGGDVVPSINGVTISESKDVVLKKFSKPILIKSHSYDKDINDHGKMIEIRYDGLSFFLADFGKPGIFKVLEIRITKPKWSVAPGLSVNQTIESAMSAYPALVLSDDPNRIGQSMLSCLFPFFNVPEGGYLHLSIKQNRISKIIITSDLD